MKHRSAGRLRRLLAKIRNSLTWISYWIASMAAAAYACAIGQYLLAIIIFALYFIGSIYTVNEYRRGMDEATDIHNEGVRREIEYMKAFRKTIEENTERLLTS